MSVTLAITSEVVLAEIEAKIANAREQVKRMLG